MRIFYSRPRTPRPSLQVLGSLSEALLKELKEMKTILGLVRVTLMLALSGMLRRFSFNIQPYTFVF